MLDSEFMAALASKLRAITDRGLATQVQIAAAVHIDQGTVPKLLNGRRQRRNETAEKLDAYANMLLERDGMPTAVAAAASQFLLFGTEEELVATIRLCTDLVACRPVTTAKPGAQP